MNRVLNMPRKLTDYRRFSADGKMTLAAWLSIKFAFGNSTLYDISIDNIMKFFHIRRDRAKKLIKLMWEDSELFYVNEKKNCVFAKGCRDKSVKINRHGGRYRSDDVMTINVPECYLYDKIQKKSMALCDVIRLIERVLVCKEYDDKTGYKYKTGDHNGCSNDCETEIVKTQKYVAKRTGLSRSKVGRILRDYVSDGIMSKTERCIKRCRKGDRYAFKATNQKTKMPYYAKCVPPVFVWASTMPFTFRNIIWDYKTRTKTKFVESTKNIEKRIRSNYGANLSPEELEFQIMVNRQLSMRQIYD